MSHDQTGLVRKVNLPMLIFYGIGTIIGAGIYVLVGKVAGYAGMQTPLAFLVAAILAGLTAFSYAELSVRFPKSGGEAIYVQEAFHRRFLSTVIGCLIVVVAMTSTATLLNGFIGYLREFVTLPATLAIVVMVVLLTLIVIWGIGESVTIAGLMTLLEIFGLLVIIWVARDSVHNLSEQLPAIFNFGNAMIWSGVLLGAFVAFYAFIGFEDMVNIAEEIKNPAHSLPVAIIVALVTTTLFYFFVALVSVLSVSPQELAASDAPLALIYRLKTGNDPYFIAVISIVSILNGALVQLVMASRILYGMAKKNWLPAFLAKVNPKTHTPVYASLCVGAIVLLMALTLPLLSLAKLTSFITLSIFIMINAALWRIKCDHHHVRASFTIPLAVPVSGVCCCSAFLLYQLVA